MPSQRLPQRRVQRRCVRRLAGEEGERPHRLPDQQVDTAYRPQPLPRRRLQQRRAPGMVDQIVHHGVRRHGLQKVQPGKGRTARHAQRCGVHQQVTRGRRLLYGVLRQHDALPAAGELCGQRRGTLQAAGAHDDPTCTGCRQRVAYGLGCAACAQQQHRPTLRVKALPGQTVQKARAVGVVADGTSLPDAHGVHRAAGSCRRVHLIQQGEDGLLVGHGHVEAGAAAVLGPPDKGGKLLRAHRPHVVAVRRTGLVDHGLMEQRRQAVCHRVADHKQLLHGRTVSFR